MLPLESINTCGHPVNLRTTSLVKFCIASTLNVVICVGFNNRNPTPNSSMMNASIMAPSYLFLTKMSISITKVPTHCQNAVRNMICEPFIIVCTFFVNLKGIFCSTAYLLPRILMQLACMFFLAKRVSVLEDILST